MGTHTGQYSNATLETFIAFSPLRLIHEINKKAINCLNEYAPNLIDCLQLIHVAFPGRDVKLVPVGVFPRMFPWYVNMVCFNAVCSCGDEL